MADAQFEKLEAGFKGLSGNLDQMFLVIMGCCIFCKYNFPFHKYGPGDIPPTVICGRPLTLSLGRYDLFYYISLCVRTISINPKFNINYKIFK